MQQESLQLIKGGIVGRNDGGLKPRSVGSHLLVLIEARVKHTYVWQRGDSEDRTSSPL